MPDQPIRHRGFAIAIAILTIVTVPFAFVGRPVRIVWGIPVWLWWSMLCTVLYACVTAWGVLRLWKDEPRD